MDTELVDRASGSTSFSKMIQLVCGCLNVKIQAKSIGQTVDPTSLEGLQVKAGDEFFGQELREVCLNLEGIHVEHAFLVTQHVCGSWIVHRCDNCQMTTHATHSSPEEERVLVGPQLLSDEQAIQRLSISPEYSPLFKIVVKETSENVPIANGSTSKEVSKTLHLLQTKLNVFLVAEEQAMEERIREFQEQEQENYARLQMKAKNDKNAIINTILVNIYRNLSEELTEAMKESPVGSVDVTTHAQDVMTSVSPLSFGNYLDGQSPGLSPNDQFSPRRPVSRSESNRSKRSDKQMDRIAKREPKEAFGDDDDVFQYDPGFQDDPTQPPFSESDEDEPHDTDDSSAAEDVGVTQKNGMGNFSTSVPINVPQWGRQISHNIDISDETDYDPAPKDAETMAASIQALARSIHGDSSRVFGELPTSRTRARVMSSQSSYRH